MAVTDVVGAIVAKGRAIASISVLTGTRISAKRQDAWTLPGYAIVVNGPRGGPRVDPPLRKSRLDLECYGPDERTSKLLAETVVQAFVPDSGSSPCPFTAAGTAIGEISLETEPIWLPDPDTGWPRTIVPLIVTHTGVAV